MRTTLLAIGTISFLAGCVQHPNAPAPRRAAVATIARTAGPGLVRREMPAEDPGPPFYARIGMQTLESDGWVAIPFYRSPAMIPADFNLLAFYHFPGPGGPGAFAAPLLMTGFTLTEGDAPQGTFPKHVELRGAGTPIWFVRADAFHAAAADGRMTLAELRELQPLEGTAVTYHETLHPRADDHKIVIQARGALADGRTFSLAITHVGETLRHMRLAFE
jgi:hypothetical protein